MFRLQISLRLEFCEREKSNQKLSSDGASLEFQIVKFHTTVNFAAGLDREIRAVTFRAEETLERAEATKARVEDTIRRLEEEQRPRLDELKRLSEEKIRVATESGISPVLFFLALLSEYVKGKINWSPARTENTAEGSCGLPCCSE